MLTVDIALPVYHGNLEELEKSLRIQKEFYEQELCSYDWKIVIAANGRFPEELMERMKQIAQSLERVRFVYTPNSGKGWGIVHAWEQSRADIRAYLDVDLATDLKSIKQLITPLERGYDICIGSRYHKDSKVFRSWKRRAISRIYHRFFLNFLLATRFSDGQCGFKAITARTAQEVLPLVKDRGWFFESEMLWIAERRGYKIREIPVVWKETDHSSVNLVTTIPLFILRVFQLFFRAFLKNFVLV